MAPDEESDAVQECPPHHPHVALAPGGRRCAPAKASPRRDCVSRLGRAVGAARPPSEPRAQGGAAFGAARLGIHLPPGGGTTANAPKRWVAADVDAFIDVYMELGPLERHAYELLEATRSCHLFFDLDGRSDGKLKCDEAARCIAEEAASTSSSQIQNSNPKGQSQS